MTTNLRIGLIASVLAMTGSAQADSILLEGSVEIDGQQHRMQSMEWGWRPNNDTETFKIAGKTCTFGTSARGSVPNGCNYTVTISSDGTAEMRLRHGNNVCTAVQPSCQ